MTEKSRPTPASPFPAHHALQGAFEPWLHEGEIQGLPVTGAIPEEIRGIYFRNGPNPQHVLDESYHIFDGDGMVHAFEFSELGVHYRNKWVRTEKFEYERAAGRSLFGGIRKRWKDPSVADKSPNAANTHVIWHGGKLLALWEAGLPTELDPRTLDTLGPWDFHGGLERAMTAHPKVDPATGDLLFFAHVFGASRELTFYRADKSGRIVESRKIPMPFPCMMHDFAITESFILFPVFPLTLNMEKAAQGKNPIAWEPALGTRFGLMPRLGNGEVTWFRTDACFAFHFMNAYEENGAVILDAIVIDRIPEDAKPFQGESDEFPTRLIRWSLDLVTRAVEKEILDETGGEMPRMDDRFCGRKFRHGFFAAQSEEGKPAGSWNAIVHFDFEAKSKRIYRVPGNDVLNEAIFVPKSCGAEGEGYLLSLVYRDATGKSDLLILDAAHIEAGPVAVVHIPHRIPVGFHGCWMGVRKCEPPQTAALIVGSEYAHGE